MTTKLPVALMLLCTFSYATAATSTIGTATARGDMRVDGYTVKGDATLFDGTVVETGQASAALRLNKGVEIKLSTDSRGTLYRDRLVLQKGASEWTPSSSFQVDANGLLVTPNEPNSRGVVSMGGTNTVEVAALSGGFKVTDDRGQLLASVTPGHAMSFGALQAATQGTYLMTVTGKLTSAGGHYFVKAQDTGSVYEVTGSNLESLAGKTVTVSGTLDPNIKPAGNASAVITASSVNASQNGEASQTPAPAGTSGELTNKKKLILGALIVGGATGAGIGVYEANESPRPASR